MMLAGFSSFALVLAALGIYAVISYSVQQRTQELGIRTALGASPGSLQTRIILETLRLAAIGLVSIAPPFLGQAYASRWFGYPRVLVTGIVPLLVAVAAWRFRAAVAKRSELAPFVITLAVFLLSFAGLGISIFPYLIPNSVTLEDAAAPASSQVFMLVGAGVLVPLILGYTAWSYWVFRGKVGHEGYH